MCLVVLVATFALCTVLRLFIQRWRKERKLPVGTVHPPMPPVSSILGHEELNLRGFHCTKAVEWAKEYGPVYRLNLNFTDVVVLSDVKSIKKFCKNSDGLYRSGCFIVGRDYNKGLATQNGECWIANKRYCMSVLRDLGFAKTSMEERMMDDFRQLDARISDRKGQAVHIRPLILSCVANNIMSFFYPNGLPGEDAALHKATSILDRMRTIMLGGAVIQFSPSLIRNLHYHIPFSRNGKVDGIMNEMDNFIRDQIENYKPSTSENDGRGFIEGYMKKIEEVRQEALPKFQERFLIGNVKTFLIAGTFSTTNTMHWHLLNFAARQEIQTRVQREIDEVVGTERLPTWEDRRRMPYTLACSWEIHRWKPAPPLGMPREANEDIVVDDFIIPRGTVVLFNLWAAHYDADLWPEPQRFDPSRFLDKDGCFVPEKLENVIAFSVGKRSCPGEVFASMEIFLLVTFLLQKYRVVLEQPLQYDIDDPTTSLDRLDHVKVQFVPRHSAET
ncbi:cytochrome P450 2C23-like [Dermacentor silvarum]|uniref:cytochrome P450 2C23-like n=1 Tax=Dermacentor silvarum TaxID=543639 RepID=UPI0021011FB9|nr:cytochrome P450 2C23-like [Dermacentor silvarum]